MLHLVCWKLRTKKGIKVNMINCFLILVKTIYNYITRLPIHLYFPKKPNKGIKEDSKQFKEDL